MRANYTITFCVCAFVQFFKHHPTLKNLQHLPHEQVEIGPVQNLQ